MWWVRKAPANDAAGDPRNPKELGRCRRHSPGQAGGPGWPPVFDADWCGDHRIDENRLPTGA